ncbi:FtsX-like permease family protein [Streptomyces zaomyceticus]|uniref:FtsX-like permease family protein n=1 Tax=Streptomyces zaomyceticus TaxID=68286 RepID=UPI0033AB73A8
MRPLVMLPIALAGDRLDRARFVLTALGAALGTVALLSSATVLAIDASRASNYTNDALNESGLRPGVAFGMLLMTIPVLTFVAQCSRMGAPARERRLAALRMAGATPRQVVQIAAVETSLAALLGVASGFGAYFAGRVLLDAPDTQGRRPLPTDVLPGVFSMAVIATLVPLFITGLAVLTMRRVVISPLGVVRNVSRRRPRAWPGVLLLVGIGACALVEPVFRYFADHPRSDDLPAIVMGVLIVTGVLSVSVGLVGGTGWITYEIGRLLHRWARRPAGLLAGRRLMADPWAGSRTFAALIVALLVGSAAAGLSELTVATVSAQQENARRLAGLLGESYEPTGTAFYERTYDIVGYAVAVSMMIAVAGLLVALAEGVLSRRRTLASLLAAGTPRGVLSRAMAWQAIAPVVPAVALAVIVGVLLPRFAIAGGRESANIEVQRCVPSPGDPADSCHDTVYDATHQVLLTAERMPVTVHIPWGQVGMLAGGAIAATVAMTVVGLAFLRTSTRMTELRTS